MDGMWGMIIRNEYLDIMDLIFSTYIRGVKCNVTSYTRTRPSLYL